MSENHKSACLLGWRRSEQYFATQLELSQFCPGASPGGIQLNPDMIWYLPTLASDSFSPSP